MTNKPLLIKRLEVTEKYTPPHRPSTITAEAVIVTFMFFVVMAVAVLASDWFRAIHW